MRQLFRSALHLAIVFALAYPSFSLAEDGPLNTGEIELQQLLRDANKHDVERYPHGEIECEITKSKLDGPVYTRKAVSHMWWLGEKFRVLVDEHSKADAALVKSPQPQQGITESEMAYELTADDKRVLSINDVANKAILEPRAGREFPPNVRIGPRDWWFGHIGGEGRFWYESLGPYPSMPPGLVKSFHTKKLNADKIEIERIDVDGCLRVVASTVIWKVLDCDYEGFGKRSAPSKITYHYQWSDSGDRLVEFTFKHLEQGRNFMHNYKVKKVDTLHKPPETMFSTDISRVKDGYYVEDRFSKKTFLKGEKGASQRLGKARGQTRMARGYANAFCALEFGRTHKWL